MEVFVTKHQDWLEQRAPVKGIRKHAQIGGGLHTGFAVAIMSEIMRVTDMDVVESAILTISFLMKGPNYDPISM